MKGMNRPTQLSFFCTSILDAAKAPVCALVDRFVVCLLETVRFYGDGPETQAKNHGGGYFHLAVARCAIRDIIP